MDSSIEVVTFTRFQNDFTVNVFTKDWKYTYFHVSKRDAKWTQRVSYTRRKNEIWKKLKRYEFGKTNIRTCERFLGSVKL